MDVLEMEHWLVGDHFSVVNVRGHGWRVGDAVDVVRMVAAQFWLRSILGLLCQSGGLVGVRSVLGEAEHEGIHIYEEDKEKGKME